MWLFIITVFAVYNNLLHQIDAIKLIDLPRSDEQSRYREISHVKRHNVLNTNYKNNPIKINTLMKRVPHNIQESQRNIKYNNILRVKPSKEYVPKYPPVRSIVQSVKRRNWLLSDKPHYLRQLPEYAGRDKDDDLKTKIGTLVQQALHDTEAKVKSVQYLKDKYRDQEAYKAGFVLSMVKKTRDVLNELFNVAVKRREEWKALEQLKIFELIVHTNVDTTNLVRQLVEIHVQHLNSTNDDHSHRKVVLL